MRRSMQILSRGPRTYLHGDLHIANTYRTQEGTMGIADWQVGLKGSWAHDVAYLITTALGVEDRRRCERELLDIYLQRLAAAGGGAVSRQAAWMAYRQATFYPYFAWVYTIGRSRLQPSFQPDEISLTMVERIATAIEDLDSLSAVGL
jgi:aminoglycoside/choline kinase family phosphotransferase